MQWRGDSPNDVVADNTGKGESGKRFHECWILRNQNIAQKSNKKFSKEALMISNLLSKLSESDQYLYFKNAFAKGKEGYWKDVTSACKNCKSATNQNCRSKGLVEGGKLSVFVLFGNCDPF